MNRRTFWLVALSLGLVAPSFTFAQDRADRGGRAGFDPARMREAMITAMKDQLGVNAEEWTVIQPKIDKLMTAQRDNMSGRGFNFRGGGSGGGRRDREAGGGAGAGSPAADGQQQSPVQQASRELREALAKKETAPEQITAKLTALREARAKAREQLTAAQEDLRSVLTPRQEAVMVSTGMLE